MPRLSRVVVVVVVVVLVVVVVVVVGLVQMSWETQGSVDSQTPSQGRHSA